MSLKTNTNSIETGIKEKHKNSSYCAQLKAPLYAWKDLE